MVLVDLVVVEAQVALCVGGCRGGNPRPPPRPRRRWLGSVAVEVRIMVWAFSGGGDSTSGCGGGGRIFGSGRRGGWLQPAVKVRFCGMSGFKVMIARSGTAINHERARSARARPWLRRGRCELEW